MRWGVFRLAALAVATLMAGTLSAEECVLYWMVDDTVEVRQGDGTTMGISEYVSSLVPSGSSDTMPAARIRVTGGGLTEDTFLPLYCPDGTIESGEFGVDLEDNGSGHWGAGVPTGLQSPVGEYAAGSPEYSFIIELGNVTWDGQSLSWVTTAASAATAYSSLGDSIGTDFDLNPQTITIWKPTSYTAIPEPSSGLLALIGGALLALRRRGRN